MLYLVASSSKIQYDYGLFLKQLSLQYLNETKKWVIYDLPFPK